MSSRNALVTRLIDGDTLDADRVDQAQRLTRFNAPGLNEEGGCRARLKLAGLISGRQISVEIVGSDTYRRSVTEGAPNGDSLNGHMRTWLLDEGLTPE